MEPVSRFSLNGVEDPIRSRLGCLELELSQARHLNFRKKLMEEVGVLSEEDHALLEV